MAYGDTEFEEGSNFVVNHWRGLYPLSRAYWINGLLINGFLVGIAVIGIQSLAQQASTLQLSSVFILLPIPLALASSIWSCIGIWRSADKHEARGGNAAWAAAAKLMVIMGTLTTVGNLASISAGVVETTQLALNADPLGDPAKINGVGDTITIRGPISLGTFSKFQEALAKTPNARRVELDSHGGRLKEASQIATLVERQQLDTKVVGQCESACTIVLLSGVKRFASPKSQIGFHQPSFPGLSGSEAEEMITELRRTYLEKNLPRPFVERALAVPSNDMWYPNANEAFEAGVLNAVESDWIVNDNMNSAKTLNEQAPKRLDDVTVLESVKANGNELQFNYTIDADASQIDKHKLSSLVLRDNRERICREAMGKRLIEGGASYRFAYLDRLGRPILNVQLTSC